MLYVKNTHATMDDMLPDDMFYVCFSGILVQEKRDNQK